jgi:orotidine-5'-phosphate decarboxylase
MTFADRLAASWARSGSLLCVGLDPDPARYPEPWRDRPEHTADFCIAIVEATADIVCAFKPQVAYFSAIGAEDQLERVISHVRAHHPELPLILDAKRGDIGPTAEQYAKEAFDRYGADAVTVNPYLGLDAVAPFLDHERGAVLVLCRTSNPGSGDFQLLEARAQGADDTEPVYAHVARRVTDRWGDTGRVGLVVGATFPRELAEVRELVGDLPILVPGVGAQGGDPAAIVTAGATADGTGLVVNSSRDVLYAHGRDGGHDFAAAARAVAEATRAALGGSPHAATGAASDR